VRLHYHPTSPYSRKAAVAVRLRGDPVDLRLVDVVAGEHRTDAFRALSPFGKMPVLELDGDDPGSDEPIVESTSIVEYLEARGPRRLIPDDPEVARQARHWDRLGDLYLLDPQSTMFFQAGTEAENRARVTADRALALLDRRLADGRQFVCGDAFTLGDLATAIGAAQLDWLGVPLPDGVAAWMERCHDLGAMRTEREAARPLTEALLARRRAALGG
jgi:glutathione S-transferase